MTDAMEALYCYAEECLFSSFAAQEKGYHARFIREDQYEEQLRGLLDESSEKILDDLLKIKINIMLSESRVAFQAGYRSALELFRRATPPLSWRSFSPPFSWLWLFF